MQGLAATHLQEYVKRIPNSRIKDKFVLIWFHCCDSFDFKVAMVAIYSSSPIMAVSGLAILLSPERERREGAISALESHPQVELGPSNGDRIAAVLDTPDTHQDRRVVKQLEALDGVLRVDLVCVYFDEDIEDEPRSIAGADDE